MEVAAETDGGSGDHALAEQIREFAAVVERYGRGPREAQMWKEIETLRSEVAVLTDELKQVEERAADDSVAATQSQVKVGPP
jgi:hypothetical protein